MATKPARMEFRLPQANKELIEQAALLNGQTVTEYVNVILVEAAKETIQEHHLTRLTDRDRDIFLALLETDHEPNAALRQAFQDAGRS